MKKQFLDSFQLIERLLHIGLESNARALSFALKPCMAPSRVYLLSEEATNWQRFLRFLGHLPPKQVRFPQSEEIYAKALELATCFLKHGADAHIPIPLRLGPVSLNPFLAKARFEEYDGNAPKKFWHLILEQAAAAVFDEFILLTGTTRCEVNQHFELHKAEKQYMVREIMEKPRHGHTRAGPGPRKVLRQFTAEQEQRLISLAQSTLKSGHWDENSLSISACDSLDQLDAAILKTWVANSEHVIIKDCWPWWIRKAIQL